LLYVDSGDDFSIELDAGAQAYYDSPCADSGSVVEKAQPDLDTGFPEPDTDFPEDDNYDVFDEPQPTEPATAEVLHCQYLKTLHLSIFPCRTIPILYDLTREECLTSLSTQEMF
jgi:hypothetical protein